jgi:DNA-binding MarR family transcriptional regulator
VLIASILEYYHFGIIARKMKQRPRQRLSREEAVTQIADLLARLIGEAILFNEGVAGALGVSAVDLQTFGVIARHDGAITPSEVSAQTGLPASTVTRVLDRLEQRGFITRNSVPSDRRKIAVEVVESKAAEVAQHYAGKIAQIERLNARRSWAEVAAVVSYLSDLATDDSA